MFPMISLNILVIQENRTILKFRYFYYNFSQYLARFRITVLYLWSYLFAFYNIKTTQVTCNVAENLFILFKKWVLSNIFVSPCFANEHFLLQGKHAFYGYNPLKSADGRYTVYARYEARILKPIKKNR